MITLSAEIGIPGNENYIVDRRNILSIESANLSRSDIKLPSYGIISNTGNVEFVDYNGKIKEYAEQGVLNQGGSDVRIVLTNHNTKKELSHRGSILTFENHNKIPINVNTYLPSSSEGYRSIKLWVGGTNLIVYPYQPISYSNGITATVNSDASITFTGTASSNWYPRLVDGKNILPLGTYTLSLKGTEGSKIQFVLDTYKDGTWQQGVRANVNSSATITLTKEYNEFRLMLYIPNGATVNDTVRPMLNYGATAKPYEPYKGEFFDVSFNRTFYSGYYRWNFGDFIEGNSASMQYIGRNIYCLDGENTIYSNVGENVVSYQVGQETVCVMKTKEWDYDNNSRTVNVSIGDDLEEWQNIPIAGFQYDPENETSVLQNKSAADLYKWLYERTPSSYKMYNYDELDVATKNVLETTFFEYPLLKDGSLWLQWSKLCEVCGLYIYKTKTGRTACIHKLWG